MNLSINEALQEAVAAHRDGKFKEAEKLYRAILKVDSRHPDANHNLGVLAVSLNNHKAAIPLFKVALEVNPKVDQFWLSFVDVLIRMNKVDEARQLMMSSKQHGIDEKIFNVFVLPVSSTLEPKNSGNKKPTQQQIDTVVGHYAAGRHGVAERLAISLTNEFPGHHFGWKVLGVLYVQMCRYEEAVTKNQRAIEIAPHDPELHNNLGAAFQGQSKWIEAEASFRKAKELKEDYAEAHNNHGFVLQSLGRIREAEISYRRVISIDARHFEAHNSLGTILDRLGRFEEAETSFRKAIDLKANYPEAYNNLGVTLNALGKLPEAETSLRKAIGLNKDYSEAYNNLGVVLNALGRLDEAEANYREAIALKSDKLQPHNNLGDLLMKKGSHKEGIESLIKGSGIISFDLKKGLSIK